MSVVGNDGYALLNASANSPVFALRGGLYGIDYIATWSAGTVTLEKMCGDGSTFVTATTAFSANGYVTAYLPPGNYKLVVATATGVYVELTRVPLS